MENIQLSLFGRTSQGLSLQTGAQISKWYLMSLSEYQTPTLKCQRLQRGRPGQKQMYTWGTDGALLTELSTRNTGEFPSVGEESFLSQILEENAPTKYYLSATACKGILRRSKERGKKLPELLETALKQQVTRSKSDAENPGGGKGALIQKEKSATLATSNDQTLFAIEGNGTRESHTGTGYAETETMYTLNTVERHAVSYQKTTGPLMANSHPGSYTGQDAYQDMLITEKDVAIEEHGRDSRYILCGGGTTVQTLTTREQGLIVSKK